MEESSIQNNIMPHVPKKSAWRSVFYIIVGLLSSIFLPMAITWVRILTHNRTLGHPIDIFDLTEFFGSIVLWATGALVALFIIFWKKNKSLLIGLSVGYIVTCAVYKMLIELRMVSYLDV